MNEIIEKGEPIEVEQEEKESNWKFIIIFSSIYVVAAVGISFIVSVIMGDFTYTETIAAIFGVLALLFMMMRIWTRGSRNLKKEDKSFLEDKTAVSYKNWFRMQLCLLANGLFLLLLSLLFFFIFSAN